MSARYTVRIKSFAPRDTSAVVDAICNASGCERAFAEAQCVNLPTDVVCGKESGYVLIKELEDIADCEYQEL